MNVYAERLEKVRSRLTIAADSVGRDPNEIRLLAVSKNHPASAVREMSMLGQACFGENRLQEALQKRQALEGVGIEWHFIGAVQSNKTRDIAPHFDWVQSVDREKILRRLAAHRPPGLNPLNICLQVNIDNEPQKAGIEPGKVTEMADLAAASDRLVLRGLMCIPRFGEDETALRESFSAMRQLFTGLKEAGHPVDTLSMGMSADLEAAIAEGSTMIRVGTDLFGPRA